jgi:hypothetical protein
VVILVASLVPIPSIKLASVFLLYGVVLAVAVDSFLLRRRLAKLTLAKFGDKAHGAAGYGMMRSLQLRRTRLPRAQVQRGQFPS